MKLLLGIVVVVLALADAGQSPLQRRVVKDVLDYFHSRSNVQFLFREQSVEGAVERVSAGGGTGTPVLLQGGCGIVWGEGRAVTEWGHGGWRGVTAGDAEHHGSPWASTVVPAGTAWGSATH